MPLCQFSFCAGTGLAHRMLICFPTCYRCSEPILPQPVHHDITREIFSACCVWLIPKQLPSLPLYRIFFVNQHLADPLHNPTYFQCTRCCSASRILVKFVPMHVHPGPYPVYVTYHYYLTTFRHSGLSHNPPCQTTSCLSIPTIVRIS